MKTFSLAALSSVSFYVLACGGTAADTASAPHADTYSASSSATVSTPTSTSSPIASDDTAITLRVSGGLNPEGADTSACTVGVTEDTYTFTLATRELSWTECRFDPAKNKLVTGAKVLTVSEAAPVIAALAALRPVAAPGPCGSDWTLQLDIVSSACSATRSYYPPFLHCDEAQTQHLSGLDDLLNEVVKIVQP